MAVTVHAEEKPPRAQIDIRSDVGNWVASSTVVARNLATNPSFETTSGTVEVRRNYVTNPGVEVDTTGYAAAGSATFARDTTQFHSGVASLRVVSPTGGFSLDGVYFTGTLASPVGTVQTAGAWVLAPAGINLFIEARVVGTTNSSTQNNFVATGAWQWVTATVTNAVAGTQFMVHVRTNGAQVVTYYVDDFAWEVAPSIATQFSGATAAAGDFSYAWTGTANASASIQTALAFAGVGVAAARVYQSKEWVSGGIGSLRITPNTPNAYSNVALSSTSTAFLFGMAAGKTYTVQAKIRLTAAQTGTLDPLARRILVSTGVTSGSTVGGSTFSSVASPNAAGVTTLSVTFTVPAGSVWSNIALYNGASHGNGDVWWDSLMVVEGTYTGSYFDGATADVHNDDGTGIDYQWVGAANASASVAYVASFVVNATVTFTTLTLYRDGAELRKQPFVGQTAAVVDDFELPRQVDVVYRLVYAYSNAPTVMLENIVTVRLDVDEAWMIHPLTPQLSVGLSRLDDTQAGVVEIGGAKRATTRSLHWIIGAPDPVHTSTGKRRSTSRPVKIETTSAGQWQAITALFDGDQPVMFIIPPSWQLLFENGWYSVDDVDEILPIETAGYNFREWSLPIQKAVAPITIIESLWSRMAYTASGLLRGNAAARYLTRLDLMQNRRSD